MIAKKKNTIWLDDLNEKYKNQALDVFNCGGLHFNPNKRISEAEPALERCGADISKVSLVWISDDGNTVILNGREFGLKTVTREKRKKQVVAKTLQEQNSMDLITQEEFEQLVTDNTASGNYPVDTIYQNPLATPGIGSSNRYAVEAFVKRGYDNNEAKGLTCHKGRPYLDISNALKDGDINTTKTIEHPEKRRGIYTIPVNELISGLDSAMKKSVTVKDAVVFSGVTTIEELAWRMLKDGETYVPNIFMSFTHSAKTAQSFSESGMCVKIILPAGSHAVEFGDHEKSLKTVGDQRQSEVLADRKYGYRKKGEDEVHGEYVYVPIELVEFSSQEEFDEARKTSNELEGRLEELENVFGDMKNLFEELEKIDLVNK